MKKKEIIFLIIILVLATSLRIYNLENKYYGIDEGHTLLQGREIVKSQSIDVLKEDAHPPLYFTFIGILDYLTNSEYFIRILMILVSLITITFTYFFTKDIINEKVAGLVALLMSTSPFYIIFSHQIRAYSILFLFFIISTYYLHKFLFKEDKKSIYYLPFIYLLSFYSHIFTAFYILAHFITVIYFKYKYKIKYFKEYAISITITIMGMLLWIPMFLTQYKYIIIGDHIAIQELKWYFIPYPFHKYAVMANLHYILSHFNFIIIITLLINIIFIYGIIKLYKKDKKITEFLCLVFFPVFIVMALLGTQFKIYSFRYFSYLYPIYIIFLANGLNEQNKKRIIILTLIIIAAWLYLMNDYYSIMHLKRWNALFGI